MAQLVNSHLVNLISEMRKPYEINQPLPVALTAFINVCLIFGLEGGSVASKFVSHSVQ